MVIPAQAIGQAVSLGSRSSILYHLPFGRGQHFGGGGYTTNLLIGGWQVNIIGRMASGNPFDLSAGSGTSNADRPDFIAPLSYPKSISGTWFNTASFARQPVVLANGQNVFTRLGTLRRDLVYGPGQRSADVSVQKNIQLTERYVLELHGDAFNVTNTPQFTNPDGTLTDANYGKVTGIQLDSHRELQIAARFTF